MSIIINTSDLSVYMGKTLDGSVSASVTKAINVWVENRTNRVWGTTKQVIERYDWAPLIWLRHQDIVSLDFVKMGYPGLQQSTLDGHAYFWNKYGRVTMYLQRAKMWNPSPINNDLVEMTYTYGVTTVPDDLKLASLGIAAGFYNWATNNQKDIVAANVGSYRLEYAGRIRNPNPKGDPAKNINDLNWDIVESYRMQRN